MHSSKISRLPHQIREQLNQRLLDNNRPAVILKWLNSLPEAKAILASDFEGRPITKQNLSEWRFAGFRDWLLHRQAKDFFASLSSGEAPGPNQPEAYHAFVAPKSDEGGTRNTEHVSQLLHWTILQYAATARQITSDHDPRSNWNRLRELSADITRLRRSDLYSQYLDLQRDWLNLEQSKAGYEKEKQFWAWTKREDIRAKILEREKPVEGGLTDEAIKEITEKLNIM